MLHSKYIVWTVPTITHHILSHSMESSIDVLFCFDHPALHHLSVCRHRFQVGESDEEEKGTVYAARAFQSPL